MKENPPGHIGLISENHPGMTDDMWALVSNAAAPFSSPSLGLFNGESVAAATVVGSAMTQYVTSLCLFRCALNPGPIKCNYKEATSTNLSPSVYKQNFCFNSISPKRKSYT